MWKLAQVSPPPPPGPCSCCCCSGSGSGSMASGPPPYSLSSSIPENWTQHCSWKSGKWDRENIEHIRRSLKMHDVKNWYGYIFLLLNTYLQWSGNCNNPENKDIIRFTGPWNPKYWVKCSFSRSWHSVIHKLKIKGLIMEHNFWLQITIFSFPWIFISIEAFQKLCLLVSGSPWLRQNLKITKIHCRPTSWYLTASWTPGDTWTRGYAEIGHRANQVNCKIAKFIQLKLKVWTWQYLNKL